ncbi:hypothetical protein N865_11510 [Intrasporangium oryzae NRRL B-24470]|uniref:Uncharacterized protein n=1 Tax=Intrasporangium oryzae NRRL B-24470 TaxID=1386089 RepID=W9G784_9MICO|nr:hypothetical protein N865_11510 [Intrasporangium oryzae NRRL B-24470]
MDALARRLRHAIEGSPHVTSVAGGLHACRDGTHTRLADGRLLCWAPGPLLGGCVYAVDAEIAEQPVPRALGRRSGLLGREFWRLWTRAEARAKVRDVPIIVWIDTVAWTADADLPDGPRVEVFTVEAGDLVVSYAVAELTSGGGPTD